MEYKLNHCYKFIYNDIHNNRVLEELVIYLGPSYFDWQYKTYENNEYRPATNEELAERKPKGHSYYSVTHDKLVTASAGVSMLPVGSCTEIPIDQITDPFTLAKIYNHLNIPFTVTRTN